MMMRIGRHIGNRGAVLALLGLIWILTGVGLLAEPARIRGLPDESWPLQVRAGLWLAPGALAVIFGLWRRVDGFGWGVLIVPVALRALSHVYGFVTGTYATGWRGSLVYLAVGSLIFFCARGLDRPAPWNGQERRRVTGA